MKNDNTILINGVPFVVEHKDGSQVPTETADRQRSIYDDLLDMNKVEAWDRHHDADPGVGIESQYTHHTRRQEFLAGWEACEASCVHPDHPYHPSKQAARDSS